MSDPRDDLAALIDRVFDEFEPAAVRDEISDAILAAGWRAPVPHCDHDWSADRSTYGGNPWRECHLCGKQEDL